MLTLLMFAAAAQPAPLSKLIERCDPIALSHGGCGDLNKPVWRRFVDATGESTKINMQSIKPMQNGGVLVTTYTYSPGSNFDLDRLRQLFFTCHGQYSDMADMQTMHDAPPRSVAGLIAKTVCPIGNQKRASIRASNARTEAVEEARALNPRPQDYCQGFSTDACSRIQSGVNALAKPRYCKPGYGLVDSGLDNEQRRICDARSPKDFAAERQ